MFESATVKLTAWYLLILMSISLVFSLVIYNIASSEINTRLTFLQTRIEGAPQLDYPTNSILEAIRSKQIHEAESSILIGLVYLNLCILILGGVGSYLLARRTLAPIEAAHEAQSRFTSDASHELRTPLAVMKTELEVALRDPNLRRDEMYELLGSNLEEVDKLSKLSQTLLSLSRLDYASLKYEKVDIGNLVEKLIKKYDKTSSRITLNQVTQPLYGNAHAPSVEELFTILIDNALKYSPSKSVVSITLARRSGKASFEISNAGPGIAAKNLPHIFERFYRADNARTSSSKSSFGLGLSLAKAIVEAHNGELTASSAPGKLTTFTVLLPLWKNPIQKITPIDRQ